MEDLDCLIADENISMHLESIINTSKIATYKDVDNITTDWTFLDDIEITAEDNNNRYSYQGCSSPPMSSDLASCSSDIYLPRECTTCHSCSSNNTTENDVFASFTLAPKKADGHRGNSSSVASTTKQCKNCGSESDSQYDSGVGESLSGCEGEESGGIDSPLGEDSTLSADVFSSCNDTNDMTRSLIIANNEHQHASVLCNEVEPVVKPKVNTKQKQKRKSSSKQHEQQPDLTDSNKRYNLRTSSVINRIETDQRKETPKKPKPKTRPPPLSKYRRKTANARERTRMVEINDGFEYLKTLFPQLPQAKLTKITTLRLAINYIRALREMLGYDEDISNVSHEQVILSTAE